MGADIFESYVGSIVATIAIGATAAAMTEHRAAAVALPLITVMVGLVASLVGIAAMKVLEKRDPSFFALQWFKDPHAVYEPPPR